VAWILVNKIWTIFRGPVSLYFLIRYLSPEQQGIWYSFVNLGALTTFAELGFTMIITQFVSHEYVKLRLEKGFIVGDQYGLDRLFSLVRYSIRFYFVVIPGAVAVLFAAGLYLFNDKPSVTILAWMLYALFGGANLMVALLQSIYQGLNKVADVQKNIFIGSLLMPVLNWILLIAGLNIWALVIGNFAGFMVMSYLLYRRAPEFWIQVRQHVITNQFNWFREIVTLQWKYAISWGSGYFIFNFYVPAIYKIQGAVAAGQLGMSLTMIRAVFNTSFSWIESKIPLLNMMVGNKERTNLFRLFMKTSVRGFLFYILGSSALIVFVYLLNVYTGYGQRFIRLHLILLFCFAESADVIIGSLAIYLRAHKEEPFYWFSLLLGIVIPTLILGIVPYFGLEGMLEALILLKWIVAMPIAIRIFISFKKKYDAA
jgi:hypothetical protein